MLATLLQQWARRYLRVTQAAWHSPHDGARTRAFYANGVNKLRFSWAVGVIPTLIHLSLFLFFVGILIYLFNVNHTVFLAVVWWVSISAAAYLATTFMQPFWPSSPYFTPLTSIVGLLWHVEKKARKNIASTMDGQILKRIFDSVVDDHEPELVEFFQGIPGFCQSSVVEESLRVVTDLGKGRLDMALEKLLKRTWPSISLANSDDIQRLVDFVKVADILRLPHASSSILKNISLWDRHTALRSVEVGQALRSRSDNRDAQQEIGLCIQCVVAGIISNVQESDDRWIALAADQLGLSEDVIRDYLKHGKDNVLLANLTDITRKIIESSGQDSDMANASLHIYPTLINFDIQKTLPELQRDFRKLWVEMNEVARKDINFRNICDKLCNLYDISYASDGLPPGWEVRHNLGGRIYYIDHNKECTTWDQPSSYPGPGNDSLPSGWEIGHTPDGRIFYIDDNTKHTTWTRPSSNPDNNNSDNLPLDWEVRHDAHGLTFYTNHNTGKTTWTHPSKPSPYVAPTAPAISREISQRAPDQSITNPTYEFLPEAIQRPISAVASSSRTAEGDGRSGTLQALAPAATATEGGIADTQSGEQPTTVRLDSSSAPPADVHSPTDFSIDASADSFATPRAASVILPTTPLLGAHPYPQEPTDSSEMESQHHALRLGPSSETRDPSDNSS
jgi:Family of unknown function (DUF6535)/WW domain